AELKEIARSLEDPNCRFLTLSGPGGIGKTRLALEAALSQIEHFRHGVYFVPLAGIGVQDELASAIADAVLFRSASNNAQTPERRLKEYLRDKDMLLLLDNFEHRLEESTLVGQLLSSSPHLKILTTARERLNLQGEWLFVVHSMDVPADEQDAEPEAY